MAPGMSRRLQVWVTRAEPGASATAALLDAVGHAPLIAPLLRVVPLPAPPDPPPADAALAFTSANAVRAFVALYGPREAKAFAVGDATAEAARHGGFTHVASAQGDVAALAADIAAAPPDGMLLHPCALAAAGDLSGALAPAGVTVRALPLYRTDPTPVLPPAVDAALAEGVLDAVLLHSPRAARALAGLVGGRSRAALSRVRAVGLSAACLAPLDGLAFAALEAAAAPNEAALLARLG